MQKAMNYDYDFKAYVSSDGNYGVDSIITFDYTEFESRFPKAWGLLDEVHDSTRIELLVATLDRDEETIIALCEENELDPADFLE